MTLSFTMTKFTLTHILVQSCSGFILNKKCGDCINHTILQSMLIQNCASDRSSDRIGKDSEQLCIHSDTSLLIVPQFVNCSPIVNL